MFANRLDGESDSPAADLKVCALVLDFWDERNRVGGTRGPEPIKCGLAGSFEIAFVSVRGPQVRALNDSVINYNYQIIPLHNTSICERQSLDVHELPAKHDSMFFTPSVPRGCSLGGQPKLSFRLILTNNYPRSLWLCI
jgi:hypothetical protein